MTDTFDDNFLEDEGDILERIEEQAEEAGPISVEHGDSQNEDEATNDEETKRVIKPKKRVARPRLKLDATRLVGPRGIGIIESEFKDIKFKGKGHELSDLNLVLRTLEHWAHRLFPKMSFDDCIDKIEDLGFKKNVMVHVTKIRLGMEEPEVLTEFDVPPEETVDPFDELVSSNPQSQAPTLTEEQRARMVRNRLIAEEIRMKKIQARQKQLEETAVKELRTTEIPEDPVNTPDL